jgi:hypothetical protein
MMIPAVKTDLDMTSGGIPTVLATLLETMYFWKTEMVDIAINPFNLIGLNVLVELGQRLEGGALGRHEDTHTHG